MLQKPCSVRDDVFFLLTKLQFWCSLAKMCSSWPYFSQSDLAELKNTTFA